MDWRSGWRSDATLGASVIAVALLAACNDHHGKDPFGGDGTGDSSGGGTTKAVTTAAPGTTTGVDSGSGDGQPPKLDLAIPDLPPFEPPPHSCKVVDGMDAVGDCTDKAPPDSFDPEVQWSWNGAPVDRHPAGRQPDRRRRQRRDRPLRHPRRAGGHPGVGSADRSTCSTARPDWSTPCSPTRWRRRSRPAIGDIDGDGMPEMVAGVGRADRHPRRRRVRARRHPQVADRRVWIQDQGGAISHRRLRQRRLAEIIADGIILDADGNVLFSAPAQTGWLCRAQYRDGRGRPRRRRRPRVRARAGRLPPRRHGV